VKRRAFIKLTAASSLAVFHVPVFIPPERLDMGVPRALWTPPEVPPHGDGGAGTIDRFVVQTKSTDDWVKQAWADEVEAHERSLRQASLDRDTADWSRHAYVVQVTDPDLVTLNLVRSVNHAWSVSMGETL
jgi:hypothetical protein